jgi:hypothetical protein
MDSLFRGSLQARLSRGAGGQHINRLYAIDESLNVGRQIFEIGGPLQRRSPSAGWQCSADERNAPENSLLPPSPKAADDGLESIDSAASLARGTYRFSETGFTPLSVSAFDRLRNTLSQHDTVKETGA